MINPLLRVVVLQRPETASSHDNSAAPSHRASSDRPCCTNQRGERGRHSIPPSRTRAGKTWRCDVGTLGTCGDLWGLVGTGTPKLWKTLLEKPGREHSWGWYLRIFKAYVWMVFVVCSQKMELRNGRESQRTEQTTPKYHGNHLTCCPIISGGLKIEHPQPNGQSTCSLLNKQ